MRGEEMHDSGNAFSALLGQQLLVRAPPHSLPASERVLGPWGGFSVQCTARAGVRLDWIGRLEAVQSLPQSCALFYPNQFACEIGHLDTERRRASTHVQTNLGRWESRRDRRDLRLTACSRSSPYAFVFFSFLSQYRIAYPYGRR